MYILDFVSVYICTNVSDIYVHTFGTDVLTLGLFFPQYVKIKSAVIWALKCMYVFLLENLKLYQPTLVLLPDQSSTYGVGEGTIGDHTQQLIAITVTVTDYLFG